jgi:3-isopropylmalate/(R)-2-methylmalate dehydratase small subunit
MEPFVVLEDVAAPFDQSNVDTDQIMPARYTRRPRKDGYKDFLFRDLRFRQDGSEKPDFVLNQAPFRKARILVGERNFGCGSSREQAPWGLIDYGIRCVIAADFGDIFYINSLKSGLLPVQLDIGVCAKFREHLHARPGATLRVDLRQQTVTGPDGATYRFAIDSFRKRCLLEGLDEIGVTLQHDAAMTAFEQSYRRKFDWLFNYKS